LIRCIVDLNPFGQEKELAILDVTACESGVVGVRASESGVVCGAGDWSTFGTDRDRFIEPRARSTFVAGVVAVIVGERGSNKDQEQAQRHLYMQG